MVNDERHGARRALDHGHITGGRSRDLAKGDFSECLEAPLAG